MPHNTRFLTEEKNMLLSIGMIVKNEEKYLDRCLSALKPILDNIDSELIIADTGSTDNTVEIAKKYTDNVFHFEWIKDFAAARNSTLDRAKGEWYMYLDADEVFQSCDDIIRFFKTGEYKKYQTARYTVRNYNDQELTNYSDVLVPRMSRRKGVKFTFPIHETLSPFSGPTKVLTDIADHFGYVYADEETKEAKFKRNTELLEERLRTEKDPSMLLYLQLYQSYNIKKSDESYHYLEEGMEKCRKKKDFVLVPFYAEKVAMLFNQEKWEDLITTADEYFALPKEFRPYILGTDAEVYLFKAIALRNLKRYKEAIPEYVKGIKLLKDIIDKKLLTSDMMLYCFSITTPANLPGLINELTNCCMHTKDYKEASDALQYLSISDIYNNTEEDKAKIKLEFIIMNGIDDYSRAKLLYDQLGDYDKNLLQAFVRSCIETHKDPLHVIPFFKTLYKNEPMMSALLDTLEAHFSTGDCRQQAAKMISDGYGAYYELLYFMLVEGQDVHQLLTDSFDLRAAAVFCRNLFEDMYEVVENYFSDGLESREALIAALSVYEAFMSVMAEDKKDIEPLFAEWGRAGAKLCGTEQIDDLPAQALGAAMANNIEIARKQKNYKICASAMKMLLKTYPAAKPIVSALNEKIQNEIAQMNKPKQVTEMDVLAQTVKENIADLIESGNFEQAGQLLDEYSSLMPNDPEIADLRKQMAQ